MNKNLG